MEGTTTAIVSCLITNRFEFARPLIRLFFCSYFPMSYLSESVFPHLSSTNLVVTDFDDTMLKSRSVMAMEESNKTRIWVDMDDSTPREVLGEAQAAVTRTKGKEMELIIMSTASDVNVRKEWKLATGKELPPNIQILGEVKQKGQTLFNLLKERCSDSTKTKTVVTFIDDSDLHVQQVQALEKELLSLGWTVDIIQIKK